LQFKLELSSFKPDIADSVLAGLTGHTAIYPDPPVDSADFQAAIDSYHQASADLTEARAA